MERVQKLMAIYNSSQEGGGDVEMTIGGDIFTVDEHILLEQVQQPASGTAEENKRYGVWKEAPGMPGVITICIFSI